MNANIRNSMLRITMDDGTEILGRVESLEMTRPIYDSPLDDIYPQPICNQMVCVFDMFRVNAPKAEETPRFDLDKMCRAALGRLTTQIEADIYDHAEEVQQDFIDARMRAAIRHRHYYREIYPYYVVPKSLRAWHQ